MNCEQVFQHLASANPSAANGKLEQHLNGCASCRQMADLFRPAVQLLAPGIGDDREPIEPPGERWTQVWEAVAVAEQAAAQLKRHSQDDLHRPVPRSQLIAFAAVLLAGIAIGFSGSFISRGGNVARADLARAPDLSPSAHRTQVCRYDRLLDDHMGLGLDLCAICRPKLDAELASVITLCMVCHVRPSDDVHARASLDALVD